MKTAGEWLVEQMTKQDFIAIPKPEWIQQAKAMEKQQIIDAYIKGFCNKDITAICNEDIRAKQYYNETFKSE